MSFIGNVPAEAYSPVAKDTFSGDDSTTDFTLSIPATTNGVEVLVENVQQEPTTAYTISGTTLSFTAAPTTGTNNIYVIHRGPAVQTVVPPAGVALNPSTVDATGDISTEGDLKVEVTSGGIYTITGTDTATNRTLTLPDEAGTVLTSASTIENDIDTSAAKLPVGTTIGKSTAADSSGSTAYFEAGNVSSQVGGVFYKFTTVGNGSATTFYTTPGAGEWCGVVEVHAINQNDVNRSGYILERFSYDETFTNLIDSRQNVTMTLSMSGNNMQITCTGGSGVYRVQIRVMGAEES